MHVCSRPEADFHAAVLAASHAKPWQQGKGTAGGAECFDWSKAYDTVDLKLLEQALFLATLPRGLVKPALSMYRAARAVKILDAVGNLVEPFFGLPAGCPFATFFLAIVTQPWRKQLWAMPCNPSVRTWLDDCTAFVQGHDEAIDMAAKAGETAG